MTRIKGNRIEAFRLKTVRQIVAAGFTLVEVLVAIGLLGILVLVVAEVFTQQISVQNKVRDRGALEDMRNVVRSVVNCQYSCATNVARIPANQGRWTLSPVCDDKGLKVLVTDSKGKAPAATGNLFIVNDGYICMYMAVIPDTVPGGTQTTLPEALPEVIPGAVQDMLPDLVPGTIKGAVPE